MIWGEQEESFRRGLQCYTPGNFAVQISIDPNKNRPFISFCWMLLHTASIGVVYSWRWLFHKADDSKILLLFRYIQNSMKWLCSEQKLGARLHFNFCFSEKPNICNTLFHTFRIRTIRLVSFINSTEIIWISLLFKKYE